MRHDGRDRPDNTAKSIPVFNGGTPAAAEEWLEGLRTAREVGGWSEVYTRSVLLSKLEGAAKYWHQDCGWELDFAEWEV